MTMKNAEGYPVPTEQEAIGNLTKEQNRYVRQIAVHIKEMLSFLGFELLEIRSGQENQEEISLGREGRWTSKNKMRKRRSI